jgi:general secretion pathway protein B
MSYILDALRKSEQQRKLVRDLKLKQPASGEVPPPPRPWWPVAFALLVAAAVGVGAYVALQPKASPPSVPATAEPAPPPPTPQTAPASPPGPTAVSPASDSGPIRDLAKQAQPPAPAVPAALAAARAQPDPQTVPFLREMPGEFVRAVPELTVNIHVYAPDPAQRVLYINNKQVREGEAVADGIYVENIVADGVVLQRFGTRFKLPRPQ